MFLTKVRRIAKSGFVSFWRNGSVSVASVLVMVVTLMVISSLFMTSNVLKSTLNNIKDRVDINIYFSPSATEEDMATLKRGLESLPQVQKIVYTSREDALENFRQRHQDDKITLASLDELDENPLGATFTVKAKDPSQYESIVRFILARKAADQNTDAIIDRVNYPQTKQAIDALTRIIDASNRLGAVIIVFFVIVSVLITFNTIRLAIYGFREEISVMRLVGASEMYIRGPFIMAGLMYGLVSGILTLIILYPISYYVGPLTYRLGTGVNLFDFYLGNFFLLAALIIGAGLILGAVSSVLAIRRYLKV